MSHTTYIGDAAFIHNSDYSGPITVVNMTDKKSTEIQFEELVGFVTNYYRAKKIEEIEQMKLDDILRLHITSGG